MSTPVDFVATLAGEAIPTVGRDREHVHTRPAKLSTPSQTEVWEGRKPSRGEFKAIKARTMWVYVECRVCVYKSIDKSGKI